MFSLSSREIDALSQTVSMDDLFANIHLPWSRRYLSINPRLTTTVVATDLAKTCPSWVGQWNPVSLLCSPIGLTLLLLHEDDHDIWKLDIHTAIRTADDYYSLHKRVPLIKKGAETTFLYRRLARVLTLPDLLRLLRDGIPVSRLAISRRKDLTIDLIDEIDRIHPEKRSPYTDWSWTNLTQVIDPQEIMKWLDRRWDWGVALLNEKITWNFVDQAYLRKIQYPSKRRVHSSIARYISREELGKDHPRRFERWSLEALCDNCNLTARWILDNPLQLRLIGNYDYNALSKKATIQDAFDYPAIKWRLDLILENSRMVELFRTLTKKKWKKRHLLLVSDFRMSDYWYFVKRRRRGCIQRVDSFSDIMVLVT